MIADEELKQWASMASQCPDDAADFIVEARDAIPRLIAEVERLRKELVASQDYVSLLASEIRRLRKLDKSW